MIRWLIRKLLAELEPTLERLVRAAVDEAVGDIADRIDDIPGRVLDDLGDFINRVDDIPGQVIRDVLGALDVRMNQLPAAVVGALKGVLGGGLFKGLI